MRTNDCLSFQRLRFNRWKSKSQSLGCVTLEVKNYFKSGLGKKKKKINGRSVAFSTIKVAFGMTHANNCCQKFLHVLYVGPCIFYKIYKFFLIKF